MENLATTTSFATDGIELANEKIRLEDVAHTGTTGMTQSIANFLEKPKLITTFQFGVTGAVNDILYQADLLTLLKANPIWMSKIAGMNNIRATVRITMQVNSSPFVAGGLLMHFIPNYSQNVKSHSGRFSLVSKSQQPGIKLDVNVHGEVSMDIPYIGPTRTIDLAAGISDWGRIFVTVWSPYTTGSTGPTTTNVSMWMSLHSVELTNPVAQAKGIVKGQRGSIKVTAKPHPSEQEKGPVSTVLSAVSVIASGLTAIPTLAPIAGPVAWFTNIATGVATAFGWSKPINDNFGIRTVNGLHFGMACANGIDNSQPLSVSADNKIRVMTELGGTTEDEMSLNFLKKIYCYYTTYALNTTDTVGSLLYSTALRPQIFQKTSIVNGDTVQAMSTISFLNSIYCMYRGGIEIRFHVFKTKMHTGRLLFCFSPGTSGIPTLDQTANLHRLIVDISETQEFSICFPYVDSKDYVFNDVNIGTLSVFVLNPLRCPDAASSNVYVTMEVRGTDDLEFQVPNNVRLNPITAQAGGEEGDTFCEPMGTNNVLDSISTSSQYCIGEHATSLLQLMKRYTLFRFPAFSNSGVLKFNPHLKESAVAGTTTNTLPTFGMDYYSVFSALYCYYRGGLRFRMTCSSSNNYWSSWLECPARVTTSSFYASQPSEHWTQTFTSPMVQPSIDAGFSVQVPYYNRTFASLNRIRIGNNIADDNPTISLCIECAGNIAGIPSRMQMYRAVADDFHFSYFIGVPDMVYTTS